MKFFTTTFAACLVVLLMVSCNNQKDNEPISSPPNNSDSQTTDSSTPSDSASNYDNQGSQTALRYFDTNLLDTSGNQIPKKQLAGKTIGIFFAANWQPTSHLVVPKLINLRDRNQSDFEVVFVSQCNSLAEKRRFMEQTQMNCLTLPGARSEHAARLARKFNVQALPQLVVVDNLGNVLTTDGLADLNKGGALAKWKRR